MTKPMLSRQLGLNYHLQKLYFVASLEESRESDYRRLSGSNKPKKFSPVEPLKSCFDFRTGASLPRFRTCANLSYCFAQFVRRCFVNNVKKYFMKQKAIHLVLNKGETLLFKH